MVCLCICFLVSFVVLVVCFFRVILFHFLLFVVVVLLGLCWKQKGISQTLATINTVAKGRDSGQVFFTDSISTLDSVFLHLGI